jgi:hypothetical protein
MLDLLTRKELGFVAFQFERPATSVRCSGCQTLDRS